MNQPREAGGIEARPGQALEAALADWALRHGGDDNIARLVAQCARAVTEGHSYLALANTDIDRQALRSSPLVGAPGQVRPLILDGPRLYLQRYWDYETRLSRALQQRLGAQPLPVDTRPLLADAGLFDHSWLTPGQVHWQAVAAFTALRHRLTVISGGPGTGKTYTVLRLMRVLVETALAAGYRAPRIRLAAPTGKAAARMLESIQSGLRQMHLPEAVAGQLPQSAQTLHRLLGIGPRNTRPRHDADNPLLADAVIVDEASMVDLPLMAKLLEATPQTARLILLGDRYQLSSVESGSVLAELCDAGGINAFSAEQLAAAAPLLDNWQTRTAGALGDHVVTLQTSHRFAADSNIGRLAAAVNAGDAERATSLLETSAEIEWSTSARAEQLPALLEHAQRLFDCSAPETALSLLAEQGVLCALRNGPAGSQRLNQLIARLLADRQGLDPTAPWYHGRPVIVTRNDYRAGLFNGDVGICLRDSAGHLRVWFQTELGLRAFLPGSLPEHDTVYAMTVHKSQGSEFEHITLVLPPEDHPLLSRELLYTGLTRARRRITLCATRTALQAAIARRTRRDSALAERLQTDPA